MSLVHGLRQWKNAPLVATVSILLIAIGIGANTALFTLADALLLRHLPVRNPQELVRLVYRHPPLPDTSSFAYSYQRLVRAKSTSSFSDAVCQYDGILPVFAQGVTEFVRVGIVSPNFFEALGVAAATGRVFGEHDEPALAVLSDRYWRMRFHGDPRVMGQAIQVDGHPYTISGVTAAEFHGTTVEMNPDVRITQGTNSKVNCDLVARVRPGVSLEAATAEAVSLHAADVEDWARRNPKRNRADAEVDGKLVLIPIENGVSVLRDQFGGNLRVLMAAVGLVLLMVCSNVAGLLLERVSARDKEIAIRLALGAPRSTLFAQWMTETALLAFAGGAGGLVLARTLLPVIAAMIPPLRNRSGELLALDPSFQLNRRVLLFSFAACACAALLAGVAPAWRAGRHDLQTALRSAGRSSSGIRWIESVLTAFQVAMCTLLLIGAILFLQTLTGLRNMDPGFERDHVIAFTVDRDQPGARVNWERMVANAKQLRAVQNAAMATLGLMRGTGMKTSVGLPGETVPESQFVNTSLNAVSPEYFDTMGIRVLSGRTFDPKDPEKAVLVNQTFAKKFFPGVDPVGRTFGTGTHKIIQPEHVVIGVVSDARYRSLKEVIPPTFYSQSGNDEFNHILHVRAIGDPASLTASVREMLNRTTPGFGIREVNLLRDEVERTLWRERMVAQLSAVFAAIASILAAIGLYGTLAYFVSRSRRDIGIRVAIGAAPANVVMLLGRRVGALVGIGILMGCLAAYGAAAYFEQVRVSAFTAATAIVLLISVGAATIPAWRALRIDPMTALREE